MRVLYGDSETVAKFVADLLGYERGFGECVAFGVVDDDGRLVAGCVYHNWCPESGVIEMSAAAITPRWLTRPVMREILGYAFGTCGCQLVVARIHEDNERARRLWRAMGADEYLLPRMRGRAASEAILLLTDDAWAESKFMRG